MLNTKLRNIVARIEAEEGESIRDILAHYAEQRYSRRFVAGLLGTTWHTVKKLADYYGVEFITDRKGLNGAYPTGREFAPVLAAAQAWQREHYGIEFGGRKQMLHEWAAELDLHPETLRNRIKRWGVEKALTTPPLMRGNRCGSGKAPAADHVWRHFDFRRKSA